MYCVQIQERFSNINPHSRYLEAPLNRKADLASTGFTTERKVFMMARSFLLNDVAAFVRLEHVHGVRKYMQG